MEQVSKTVFIVEYKPKQNHWLRDTFEYKHKDFAECRITELKTLFTHGITEYRIIRRMITIHELKESKACEEVKKNKS